MTEPIVSLFGAAEDAIRVFRTFSEGKPDIISLGIPPVDEAIGGLFPGATGILAAGTGVGKSSIILASSVANKSLHVGVVSLEDTPDVWGARALALTSGVEARRIRTKNLFPHEPKLLREGMEKLKEIDNVHIAYPIAGSLEEILAAIDDLAYNGCRLVWVDYIQKIRGVSDDRRGEIGRVFGTIQRHCSRLGMAVMFVSQFRRVVDPTVTPSIHWLKESGDLENEARLVLLFQVDPDKRSDVIGRVAKSTNGGEDIPIRYHRDISGTLRNIPWGGEVRNG